MARVPIQHRAIPTTSAHTHTPWLDEVEAPSLTPDGDQPPQSDKVSSVVPQQITVQTRTVGYFGAILFALLTGGHFASLKLVAHDETTAVSPDVASEAVAALGRKVDDLTNQMALMQQRQIDEQRRLIEDKRQHDELWYAVLSYQLEFGRFMRENAPRAKRPEELDRAERRLVELSQRR